jgi:hypothetical protein
VALTMGATEQLKTCPMMRQRDKGIQKIHPSDGAKQFYG